MNPQWLRQLQFDQLVSGIADYAIFLLDLDGLVVTWNEGAERIKGYRHDEIVGQHFGVFYTVEDRAAGIPALALQTAREQGKFQTEAWRVRKDGSRFFANVLIDPVHDASGQLVGYAKVTRDMTERRAMEAQLRQAQKMEAIGQLTGGVAHDFNNLLTIIIGNLDILSRELGDVPRLRRATEHAMHGAQRAATLTQQLLAFARRQPLNPKATDPRRLLADLSPLLHALLGETITLNLSAAPDVWPAHVDGHQLESALINLAVNARDAMPQGGRLTLAVANTAIGTEEHLPDIPAGDYVRVSVSDTGAGMDTEVLEHAFEPFFTTKPLGQGTGLGLSQVYGFVQQSHGAIHIASEVGEGTTVSLYLPRSRVAPAEQHPRPLHSAPQRGTETILVVEDEEDVRAITTEALRNAGYDVLEASDGPNALDVLQQHPRVGVLVTDVGLPGGINGRQLAEQARERIRSLRVLFTTGYAREGLIVDESPGPATALLRKPYARSDVASHVRALLDTSNATPPRNPYALIVEDEPLVRDILGSVLRGLGFDILETGSVREVREAVLSSDVSAEVAIVDYSLGDGTAFDVAALVRGRWPALPLIIATGHARATLALDAFIATGPTSVLTKPYSLKALSSALAELDVVAHGQERVPALATRYSSPE